MIKENYVQLQILLFLKWKNDGGGLTKQQGKIHTN